MAPPADRVIPSATVTEPRDRISYSRAVLVGQPKPDPPVKGGAKLDHRGGEKVDHFLGSWGFGMRDLRGRLERRPAAPAGRRV